MSSERRDGSLRSSKGALTKAMDTLFPQPESDACRVCYEPVVDGRWNYCSERCRRIAQAVQKMFIWEEVRERVLERDGYTCQACGLSKEIQWKAHRIGKERSRARRDEGRIDFEDVPRAPTSGFFEVDHITRLDDGGHPFDERNLQTLCEQCHREKTAAENSKPDATETRPECGLEEYLE